MYKSPTKNDAATLMKNKKTNFLLIETSEISSASASLRRHAGDNSAVVGFCTAPKACSSASSLLVVGWL